jgi:CheY-like chemotaxis protein
VLVGFSKLSLEYVWGMEKLGPRHLQSNVVRLSDFRSSKKNQVARTIFYVHPEPEGKWSSLLESFSLLKIENICSSFELTSKLYLKKPDCILLESALGWTDPIHVIHELTQMLDAPIVMICDSNSTAHSQSQIKQAYAAGLYDVLYAPLKKEEILETLEVLLKFRIQSSQNQ